MDLLCKWCGETKAAEDFLKRDKSRDYSQSNVRCCKLCNAERNRKRYAEIPIAREKQLAANDRWRKENRESMETYKAKFNRYNPYHQRARNRVRHLLRRGYWTKQPCMVCGSTINVEAHHDSYARPHWELVRWLCKDHHESWHMTIDPIKKPILKEPIARVDGLRREAAQVLKEIRELRTRYQAMMSEAEALETATWNRVIETIEPMFKSWAVVASSRAPNHPPVGR